MKNDREYDPEIILKLIAQEFKFSHIQKLLDVYFGKEYEHLYSGSVYPETFEIIEKLKDKFTFGIYSEGTSKFQNHKFRSMGISKYFEESLIFIVGAKDTSDVVSKLPKEAIIVDDKERICEFLTKNGIKAIWLNKSDGRESKKFTTIHKLLDLKEILL